MVVEVVVAVAAAAVVAAGVEQMCVPVAVSVAGAEPGGHQSVAVEEKNA